MRPCRRCGGSGTFIHLRLWRRPCPRCDGTGTSSEYFDSTGAPIPYGAVALAEFDGEVGVGTVVRRGRETSDGPVVVVLRSRRTGAHHVTTPDRVMVLPNVAAN